MSDTPLHYWTLWYPKAAATGLFLARSLIEATDSVLLHAAPPVLTVEVSDVEGQRLAYGKDLAQTKESPICRLRRRGERIEREDLWPGEADLGGVILLPGGEAGHLRAWWHAEDRKSWRWQVEFFNTLRE